MLLELVVWASAVHGMNEFFVVREQKIMSKAIRCQLGNLGLVWPRVTDEGQIQDIYLRGIVYHGGYHFTSRIVSSDSEQQVWYHNGIHTGEICLRDGILRSQSDDKLRVCRGKNLVLAIYTRPRLPS